MRKITFAVLLVVLSLPGFSQHLIKGGLRVGTAALAKKIASEVAPVITRTTSVLPLFSTGSYNVNTMDFTGLTNGRGQTFIKFHSAYLEGLGKNLTFEGFFLPTVETMEKQLLAPMVNPTHATQALYDAVLKAEQSHCGFFGVKIAGENNTADMLVLDMKTGKWQSLQKYLKDQIVRGFPASK